VDICTDERLCLDGSGTKITVVFEIKIIIMKLNTFQNNKNSYYSIILLFRKGDEIINIFLNSPLLFKTWSPNNIFTINLF
jgi:hypothetical protein